MLKRLSAKRNEEGFTLIELLVVVVILGILAAVVVFAVGGITDKGDASATATDLKTLETAEEAFYAKQKADSPTYTTEAGLVNDKSLRDFSDKHNICVASDAKSYEVSTTAEDTADCADEFGGAAADWDIDNGPVVP